MKIYAIRQAEYKPQRRCATFDEDSNGKAVTPGRCSDCEAPIQVWAGGAGAGLCHDCF